MTRLAAVVAWAAVPGLKGLQLGRSLFLGSRGRVIGSARVPTSGPRRASTVVRWSAPHEGEVAEPSSILTSGRFEDLSIQDNTQFALKNVLKYEYMTRVQQQSVPVCLEGGDVFAKAKTGTGKTLAFLIPLIERLAKRGRGRASVSGLVLSPTRELALQITREAEQLLSFHDRRLQCVVGGTSINRDIRQLEQGIPHVLVATPGRLNDLLQNHGLGYDLRELDTLVLDEADQLLEMGFRPALEQILKSLPAKEDRQTLLFSATMEQKVEEVASLAMREGFEVVDCVGDEESTHQNVPQRYTVTPLTAQAARLALELKAACQDPDHKVMVFFPAAKVVQVYCELFRGMGFEVLEMHSKKSQSYRSRLSDVFRANQGKVMFTSDVSARGMDYPDVSHVIQVGLPGDRNQYIHRLGRTARAGKGGKGMLILSEFEAPFVAEEVADLPLEEAERVDAGELAEMRMAVRDGMGSINQGTAEAAYRAWLG